VSGSSHAVLLKTAQHNKKAKSTHTSIHTGCQIMTKKLNKYARRPGRASLQTGQSSGLPHAVQWPKFCFLEVVSPEP